MLLFMIQIGPDLQDEREHAAVNRILDGPFELAVNKYPRCISMEAVPHLKVVSKNQ
jgi:hypothetical protein